MLRGVREASFPLERGDRGWLADRIAEVVEDRRDDATGVRERAIKGCEGPGEEFLVAEAPGAEPLLLKEVCPVVGRLRGEATGNGGGFETLDADFRSASDPTCRRPNVFGTEEELA